MKKYLTCFIGVVLPSKIVVFFWRLLGHNIANDAKIGFSIVFAKRILMAPGAHIGHGNYININELLLFEGAFVGRSNIVNGPFAIEMKKGAQIGNRNKILRGPTPLVTFGVSVLRVGEGSKITSDHRIDCSQSVIIGAHTIIAGAASQIWTHGYVHDIQGPGRYRVDGRIVIGNNVYVGSACVLTGGVRIEDGIIVGAGATVSRSLTEAGMYVSSGLRRLDRPLDPMLRTDLQKIEDSRLCEQVYIKQEKK